MSYINDIKLVISSKSIKRNCQILQELAEDLFLKQDQNCMQFNRNKIELIHFHLKRSLNLEDEKYSVKIKKTIF